VVDLVWDCADLSCGAIQEYANSQYWVGYFYDHGWVVEKDHAKAADW
jgi:TPR repeat protein